MHSLVKGI